MGKMSQSAGDVKRRVDSAIIATCRPERVGSTPMTRPQKQIVQQIRGSGIRDNRHRGAAGDFLKTHLSAGTLFSVVSGYFTIHAYGALEDELEQVERMRFLYGTPRQVGKMERDDKKSKAFILTEEGLTLAEQLRQRSLASQCADWIRRKADIRSARDGLLHGKMYHARGDQGDQALIGSSNFTLPGLGFGKRPNIELNLVVDSERDRHDLYAWFEEWWNNAEDTQNVKQEVLKELERLYGNQSPEFIYYLTLFHLFRDWLDSERDTDDELRKLKLPDTQIWERLFAFQKAGAKAIISKLRSLNGCILADSVGLGKTYTALAVIKYFELRDDQVLVLCPKKLSENWTLYRNNSRLNPFDDDRFRYDVLHHTDLSRETGTVNGIDLETINWGKYHLVVIDESHNFRNNNFARQVEGKPHKRTRYERLMQDIIASGLDTKVLMLSATPVNNQLADLRNQISFIAGGDVSRDDVADQRFKQSLNVESVRQTTKVAQQHFDNWANKSPEKRNREDLLNLLGGEFFTLLDGLSIARSRSQITRHFQEEVGRLGGFPTRERPVSVSPPIDLQDEALSFECLSHRIDELTLALYNPAGYLRDDLPDRIRNEYEKEAVKGFTQAGRERILISMMKVNLLKRLESSVAAFRQTLERTIKKIDVLLDRFDALEAHRESAQIDYSELPFDQSDTDDPELDAHDFIIGGKRRFDLNHIDIPAWRPLLEQDRQALKTLHEEMQRVAVARDGKFQELWCHIHKKLHKPTTTRDDRENRKVLVFTASADTANYLYTHLQDRVREEGAEIALVRGDGKNLSTFGNHGYNEILTNFSPLSKERGARTQGAGGQEIDILIATDCISEGQNLQDCDLVINYDIHWNPVRIIQRFGRIDRIGSRNEKVRMVNFWPVEDLDRYLSVRNRVEARMALVDITATMGDNLLEDQQIENLVHTELRFRDQQLLRLRKEVVDLEDSNEAISLADFSLDEFRMDLLRFLESRRDELEAADLGLYAVVPPTENNSIAQPGALFCLRHRSDETEADSANPEDQPPKEVTRINPLGRYYLVYVRENGEVRLGFTYTGKALTLLRDLASGREEPWEELCALFDQRTNDGADMQHYNILVEAAVRDIARAFQQRQLSVLQSPGGLLPKRGDQPTADGSQYELVTWLAILSGEEG